eukprot:TRINITY_DN7003_c0_g1_i1.p1 TRINITY_DN7003_c0_g1~~TRINITY_DN7003_c0_g1_i1.p1  ORF type:complete len:262 (-),score=60.71 TRINITY_DN7003_c0_g1_i1:130-915(-)
MFPSTLRTLSRTYAHSASLSPLRRSSALVNFSSPLRRSFHGTPVALHGDALSIHKNTADNNPSTPFDFTDENYKKVKQILAKYPEQYKLAATIPLLHLAQEQLGWLPLAAMDKVAKIVGEPPIAIYEVASFYTMFRRAKLGKHVLEVCTTTPCMIRGAYQLLETIKKHLNIDVGGTTADGMFSVTEVECLGACVNAPMLQLGEDYYEDLTNETVIKLIEDIKAGKQVKPGPQTGKRRNCEPAGAKTSLIEPPSGPYARPDL